MAENPVEYYASKGNLMIHRKVLSLALVVAFSSTALYAAPFGNIFHKDAPATTSQAKVEVQFNNTAEYPRQIKVGNKVKTLTSKKITRMEIPVGTSVTVYSSMKSHNPGDVLVVVDAAHPNQTVTID
jgi:hypothetical protein